MRSITTWLLTVVSILAVFSILIVVSTLVIDYFLIVDNNRVTFLFSVIRMSSHPAVRLNFFMHYVQMFARDDKTRKMVPITGRARLFLLVFYGQPKLCASDHLLQS